MLKYVNYRIELKQTDTNNNNSHNKRVVIHKLDLHFIFKLKIKKKNK